MIDLKDLANKLTDERIIELVTQLGSDEYQNTEKAIIFKTICHNVDASEASMKLLKDFIVILIVEILLIYIPYLKEDINYLVNNIISIKILSK